MGGGKESQLVSHLPKLHSSFALTCSTALQRSCQQLTCASYRSHLASRSARRTDICQKARTAGACELLPG